MTDLQTPILFLDFDGTVIGARVAEADRRIA